MPELIERTAIAPFEKDGKPVRAGQVVTLDAIQFEKAWKAGAVHRGELENASVPKADLPATQGGVTYAGDIAEAAAGAAAQIEAIRAKVTAAQLAADNEVEGFTSRVQVAATAAENDIEAIRQRVNTSREDADREIDAHKQRADKAREDADREIAEHLARIEAAKASGTDAETATEGAGAETTERRSRNARS